MIAETISLGILALPAALSTLGAIPYVSRPCHPTSRGHGTDCTAFSGVIVIVGLGVLSTYTGFVIGQFKQRYMHVHSMSDAVRVLFLRLVQELLVSVILILLIFVMCIYILTFSILM